MPLGGFHIVKTENRSTRRMADQWSSANAMPKEGQIGLHRSAGDASVVHILRLGLVPLAYPEDELTVNRLVSSLDWKPQTRCAIRHHNLNILQPHLLTTWHLLLSYLLDFKFCFFVAIYFADSDSRPRRPSCPDIFSFMQNQSLFHR